MIGIVLAALSVLGILALIGIGIFNGMAMGTAATGINLATVPLTAATPEPSTERPWQWTPLGLRAAGPGIRAPGRHAAGVA